MNKKTKFALLLLAIIILTGAPTSFAIPQYRVNLTEVYGTGSCETCHNNGSADGPRTSYGLLFEKQSNHAANASAALIAIGAPKSNVTTPTATTTVTTEETESITAEVTEVTPEDTVEEAPEETESQEETPVATEAAKSPGFGILVSLVGLFALAILAKRKN